MAKKYQTMYLTVQQTGQLEHLLDRLNYSLSDVIVAGHGPFLRAEEAAAHSHDSQ